jgi:hypothetical protein
MRLDEDHPKFTEVLTRQSSVIASVLSATARITPGRLRGQEADHMDEIIKIVQAQKAVLDALGV